MRNTALLLLITALLYACSVITVVDMQTQTIAGSYSVNPQRTWSRIRDRNAELWTVDGFGLQSLRFSDPIAQGDSLYKTDSAQKLPAFRTSMTATEVQEFVVDSMKRVGAQDVRATGLRPVGFGTLNGFRFELAMLSANGLEMNGLVNGAMDDDKLYLIVYSGARAHYFEKHLEQVERIFDSIRTDI